jgi:enoyl-[acyl-carrier protein] reductase / trans-2-enoyl-CoA reductase (NAD+)
VMPLYIALVYKVMKAKGLHEGTIEQLNRLFAEQLYRCDGQPFDLDEAGRFRMDDKELRDDVQAECNRLWAAVSNDNLFQLTDYAGYKHEFLKLFGFERSDVDYEAEVATEVSFNA